MKFDVVIIGAGIVGTACAERLSGEGQRVCLVDRASEIGGGATAEGMGHVVAMDDSVPQLALTKFSRTLWDALVPDLPAAAEMTQPGTLWVAEDDEELAAVHKKASFYREHGVACEVLRAAELAVAEPELREGLRGALRVSGDRVVYPPVAAQHLVDLAVARGAVLRLGEAVCALRPGEVELASGAVIEAREIVVAAGCATLELLDASIRSRCSLTIRPRKGHLCITDRYPGFLNHQIVELGYLKSAHSAGADSVAFNVQPRVTGQVLVGSSRQFDATTREVDGEIVQAMIRRALHFMPGLCELQVIRTWTGFRAASEDHLPLIGRLVDGVCLAAGHEGLGITTSLGTAELITDILLGRDSVIDRKPYCADREVAHV